MQDHKIKESLKNWKLIVRKYQKPNTKKATMQILNSFIPFVGLWILMYFSLDWSYWITLGLAIINAFFLARIFIIQHDCGHQSFFKSKKLNDLIGIISSFFSSVPYKYWSRIHTEHHARNGQLEYRNIGDIPFLTTEEYHQRTSWSKLKYRVMRSAPVQFLVVPFTYFAVILRLPTIRLSGWKKIRWHYFFNNLSILLVYISLILLLGWKQFLLVHIPVVLIFAIIAFWFFYVQHQHENNYKAPADKWDHLMASIRGSTFYKLPRLFQWLTGNIGLHHIHHLNSKIPNYNLVRCASENPVLNQYVNVLNFRESLKCVRNKLWDEGKQRMITFREYRDSFLRK